MNDGWIKIHRKIVDSGLFSRPNILTLWVWLLLKANYKTTKFMWNGEMIHIKEGQLLTGRKKLAESLKLSQTTIERLLNELELMGNIGQQKTNKFRIITIVNWEKYQGALDNKRTTNGQQTDTYKKDKKDKKGSKEPTRAKRVTPSRAINEVVSYLKGRLGVERLDGSESSNRRFAHLMLQKLDENEHMAAEKAKKLIDLALKDSFHAKNMTELGYLYRNAMKIAAAAKMGEISNGPKWKIWL